MLPSTASPLLRRFTILFALCVLAGLTALLTGCGGGGGGDENADPASVAPKTSIAYFQATIRPDGNQQDAVNSVAKKILRVDNPGKRIRALIDKQLKDSPSTKNQSVEKDIEPWLGRRAAVAVTSVGGGPKGTNYVVMIASKDNGKAKDLINKDDSYKKGAKKSYKGTEYRIDPKDNTAAGVVKDFLVFGGEAQLKQVVDASKGDALKDVAQYKSTVSGQTGKLGFGYIDTKGITNAAGSTGGNGQALSAVLGSAKLAPVAMSLDAATNKLTLEVAGKAGTVNAQAKASLVESLPGDAWLALGIPNLGQAIKKAIAQFAGGGIGGGVVQQVEQTLLRSTGIDLNRDIIAALGDVALFARGASIVQIGGGLVVNTPDPAAANRLITKIGALVRRRGGSAQVRIKPTGIGGAKGLSFSSAQLPTGAVNAVLKGNKLVIAYGDAATTEALAPKTKLGESADFKQAADSLGGAIPSLYLGFGPIVQLLGGVGSGNGAQVQQYLGAFQSLAAGAHTEGDKAVARIVVNLK